MPCETIIGEFEVFLGGSLIGLCDFSLPRQVFESPLLVRYLLPCPVDFLRVALRPLAVFFDALAVDMDQIVRMFEIVPRLRARFRHGADLSLDLHKAFAKRRTSTFQLLHFCVRSRELRRDLRNVSLDLDHVAVKNLEPLFCGEDIQLAQLLLEYFVAPCFAGLPLKGADLALHFAYHIREPEQVGFRVFQLADGLILVGFEFRYAAGFLENLTPVLRV